MVTKVAPVISVMCSMLGIAITTARAAMLRSEERRIFVANGVFAGLSSFFFMSDAVGRRQRKSSRSAHQLTIWCACVTGKVIGSWAQKDVSRGLESVCAHAVNLLFGKGGVHVMGTYWLGKGGVHVERSVPWFRESSC